MNEFEKALCSNARSGKIPNEHDIFGAFTGQWDIEWQDGFETGTIRKVKGEWIFSWVLDGTAVQDVFIVPSRLEREKNPQPDAEYGTTIRIYNPKNKNWDIFYGCSGEAIRLTGKRFGDEIILTENSTNKMRYVFSDIAKNSFKWRKEIGDDAGSWKIIAKIEAVRAK